MKRADINRSINLVSEIDMRQFPEEPMPVLEKLIAIGEENMEIYKLLGNSDFAMRQVEQMKTVLVENTAGAVNIPEHIRKSEMFSIHMHFFMGGILNVYQQWILGNLSSSPEEIMKHLVELILNNKPIQFVLNYPGLVDPDVLRKAAKAVIESVDASAPMSVSSMMDLRRPAEAKARYADVHHEL